MSGQRTILDIERHENIGQLPIFEVLKDIQDGLEQSTNLVVIAPPGAGKTTIIPLAFLEAPWRTGRKILVLEPRRLAARGAAHRMANLLGEEIGQRVGYRVRFDTKISDQTVVEVITEGVFNRMLVKDPALENVACVIFDEFHERSLDGDIALALCLDLQSGLREDLRLVPMSATIDGGQVAKLMQAKVIESKGRSFPVDIEYVPRKPDERLEPAVVTEVLTALRNEHLRGVLVFLPGQAEIRRVERLLKEKQTIDATIHMLFGALSQKDQQAAVQPIGPTERRVILATDIAETSLTIDGVDCVIDSGLSRQPRFEPATGFTRLETGRISLASADQRAGRAGRTGPGRAVRLWNKGQNAALPKQSTPEILNTDLSGFVLNLLDWGVSDVSTLIWMDEPPRPLLNEALSLLHRLDALDADGKLTKHGRALNTLAFSPRLANMIVFAATGGKNACSNAALLALLLQERGVGGNTPNLEDRLQRCTEGKDARASNLIKTAKRIGQQLSTQRVHNNEQSLSVGALLAKAFPDRVAAQTSSNADGFVRYKLANGPGAQIEAESNLAAEPFLIVADTIGQAGNARIVSAAPITKNEIEDIFRDNISIETTSQFDVSRKQFSTKRTVQLDALQLSKPQTVKPDDATVLKALVSAVQDHGTHILPWRPEDLNLWNRLSLLHRHDPATWPDVSEVSLIEQVETWLVPFLHGARGFEPLNKGALADGLLLLAGHPSKIVLDALVPTHFNAPSGSKVLMQYTETKAVLSIRPQELFGLDKHPTVLNGSLAISIELLSPAGRAIQITNDLPSFWRGTWSDVRSDLRGRYPKHPWPEEPLSATPTNRTKPRN